MDLLKTIQRDNGNVAIILSGDRGGFFVKAKTRSDSDYSILDFYYNIDEANKAAEVLVEGLQ